MSRLFAAFSLFLFCFTAMASDVEEIDKKAVEIARQVADAYYNVGGYRAMPKDILILLAKEKSAKIKEEIGKRKLPIERSLNNLSPPEDTLYSASIAFIHLAPIFFGGVYELVQGGHGDHLGMGLAVFWVLGGRRLLKYIPERYEEKYLMPLFILPIKARRAIVRASERWRFERKVAQDQSRLRAGIIRELRKREVPLETSRQLCSMILSDAPLVRIAAGEVATAEVPVTEIPVVEAASLAEESEASDVQETAPKRRASVLK